MQIRSIQRTIEFDFGFVKLESKTLHNGINIFVKRKSDISFYYIKCITNPVQEIMTCDTFLQDFLREHALGNKVKENVEISLSGVEYDSFVFSKVYNGSIINVGYTLGNPSLRKNRLFYANYYDLNQLLCISNSILGNYLQQQDTLKKEKEKLIEKFSKNKKK